MGLMDLLMAARLDRTDPGCNLALGHTALADPAGYIEIAGHMHPDRKTAAALHIAAAGDHRIAVVAGHRCNQGRVVRRRILAVLHTVEEDIDLPGSRNRSDSQAEVVGILPEAGCSHQLVHIVVADCCTAGCTGHRSRCYRMGLTSCFDEVVGGGVSVVLGVR